MAKLCGCLSGHVITMTHSSLSIIQYDSYSKFDHVASAEKKLKKQKSRYYVRALAPTDLRILKTDSLKKVLQFYHQFGDSFASKMKLRFEPNRLVNRG